MKRIYVDMDGVLCDLMGAIRRSGEDNPDRKFPQSMQGFFLGLEPIENGIDCFNILSEYFDVRVLTRPSYKNIGSFTEKSQWVWNHLGYVAYEKMVISGDKSILKGDYLIDDEDNANQSMFDGMWIRFGHNTSSVYRTDGQKILMKRTFEYDDVWDWKRVTNHILKQNNIDRKII